MILSDTFIFIYIIIQQSDESSWNWKISWEVVNLLFEAQKITVLQISLKGVFKVFEFGSFCFLVDVVCNIGCSLDKFHNLNIVCLFDSSGGHGWTSDSDSWRYKGALVAGYSVFIDGDGNLAHNSLNSSTVCAFASHICNEQMVVSSPWHNFESFAEQILATGFAILQYLNIYWITCCW